nr:hypothetical protein [Tanacetum cinerariifolium]
SSGSTNPHKSDRDAAFDEKEPEFERRKLESKVNVSPSSSAQTKKHDDKTKREAKGKSHVESVTRYRNLSTEFEDFSNNNINEVNADGNSVLTVRQIFTDSTNTFSATGPSNAAVSPTHVKSSYVDSSQLPDDLNMPELEDITYSNDEEDVGAEDDFTNLEITITINNDDFHTCMFACFLLQEEPKRIHQALKDPSWIESMLEELLQFENQKVWVLVDLPNGKRAIGHTQEEGINYEEVFAPVARMEAIRLFLAYAYFMGFMVYQIDVKNAFLYGTIEEELYACQPLGFEDPNYPDKRGKIDQTLFSKRQQGNILLVQIYVDDIIFGSTNKDLCKAFEKLMKDMFQMSSMGELTFFLDEKSASTPIDTEKPLLKDPDVCACAHFQVTPKVSDLHAVKRIFRYLKGKPFLGLWYPKDLPINLVAYSDSDYVAILRLV